jgi:hypothetical protein
MGYPNGATERITFEDRFRTTRRTVWMTREARKLFLLRGGGKHPVPTQGGWSGSVSASAGTHGEDAFDDRLFGFSWDRCVLWEECNWEVGFAAWIRKAILGLWGIHLHKLPKGGLLAPAADRQIVQWFQGDDALKGDRNYPRIAASGLMYRTWESYEDKWTEGTVNLPALQQAFRAGKPIRGSNDVVQVQSRLNHFTGSHLTLDGVPGPATRFVYETFQLRLFDVSRRHPWADGIPGLGSLPKLRFKLTGV